MLTTLQLLDKLYFVPVYTETARLIGYLGTQPFSFWDAAREKGLVEKFGQHKLMTAVYDLTRADRREASPPTYELTGPAREACWQLLGCPPEKWDEFYANVTDPPPNPYKKPEEKPPEPEPKPKKRRTRRKTETG